MPILSNSSSRRHQFFSNKNRRQKDALVLGNRFRYLSVEFLEQRQLLTATPMAADSVIELSDAIDVVSIATESNGDLVAYGHFNGTVDFDPGPGVTTLTASSEDLFVARYDSAGSLIKAVDLSDGTAVATDVAIDATGSVYVTANYSTSMVLLGGISLPEPTSGSDAAFVAKLDSGLQDIEWQLEGSADGLELNYVSVDSSGDSIYVSGWAFMSGEFGGRSFNAGRGIHGYVSRIDGTSGEVQWLNFISKVGNVSVNVEPTNANVIYVKEHTGSTVESAALRLDSNGNTVWQRTLDANIVWTSASSSNGGLYLAGRFWRETIVLDGISLTPNSVDAVLVRLDGATGDVSWAVQAGGPGWDAADSITADSVGNLFVAGRFEGEATFGTDVIVARTEVEGFLTQLDATNGAFVQTWRYGRAEVSDISTNNGNTYVAGRHNAANIDFPSGNIPESSSGVFEHIMQFVPAPSPADPRISSFQATPNEVEHGNLLSLQAGMFDPNVRAESVAFYHDVDSNRQLDPTVDVLLGIDNDSVDGWAVDIPAATLPIGEQSVIARGNYAGNLVTLVASDQVHITQPTTTYASIDVGQAIRDRSTVNSIVEVADSFTLTDANVIVDITHGHNVDLDVFLIHPDGTRIELFTDNAGAGLDMVTFDDHAAYDIRKVSTYGQPLIGRFRPEGSLDLLNGKSSQGTWALEVTDDEQKSTGTLNGWLLTLAPESVPAPSFSIDDIDVKEGDSGTTTATFTVTRDGDSSQTASVNYATATGTATAGTDYVEIPTTTLTFAPGVTSLPVSVSVNGDANEESDETFFVNLTNAVGGTISDAQGIGTILDDDSSIVTSTLFVYDIRFDSKRGGKDHRAIFEIRTDSDGDGFGTSNDNPVAGVDITVTFAGTTYSGTTDSSGVFRTPWVRNTSAGDHYANAVDLALAGFIWDQLLDLEDDSDGDGKPDDLLTV